MARVTLLVAILTAVVMPSYSVGAIIGVPGDCDGSFTVDLDDFVILKDAFGIVADPSWFDGDFDLDHDVDLDDFSALKTHFGEDFDPSTLPDLNCDGYIDLMDMLIVKANHLYGTEVFHDCPTGDLPVGGECIGGGEDGDIDLDDFIIFKNHFGMTTNVSPCVGDFDEDMDVDLDDFVILKRNFGTAMVPEPTSLVLLAMASGIAFRRTRGR